MKTSDRIKFLKEALKLKKHPEGGYYKEVFRSPHEIEQQALINGFNGSRSYSTSIYFLLTSESFSSFHRIKQDETWHFYEGSSITLHTISPQGEYSKIKIGSKPEKGHVFQYTVSGGYWFAAQIMKEDSYALVGCTVSPGFDFDDFELGKRDELINSFPKHSSIITDLTYH